MTPRGGTRIGAGRKPASTTGKPNGRRVNVYLSPGNFETWRGLPPRQRSKFVNLAIVERDMLKAHAQHLADVIELHLGLEAGTHFRCSACGEIKPCPWSSATSKGDAVEHFCYDCDED